MNLHRIPEFSLPSRRGGMQGTRDLLQQEEMVLAVVHGDGCEECRLLLDELAGQAPYRDMTHAAAMAIVGGQSTYREDLPFSVLEDRDGSARRMLAESVDLDPAQAFIVVANRFGEPVNVKLVHGADRKRLVEDAFDWVDFVEMECPECGVSTW